MLTYCFATIVSLSIKIVLDFHVPVKTQSIYSPTAVADPGFPMGGAVDSRGGYVSKILYVEMKESGPLGGRAPGTPPSRSANGQQK